MRRKAIAIVATALVIGTGCGSDDSSAETFCDNLEDVQGQLNALDQADPTALDAAADTLSDLDPPDEIADSYDNVVDVYTAAADDDGSLTDPALATKFADVRNDITRIDDYITDTCTDE
jgi:hypothetical protein